MNMDLSLTSNDSFIYFKSNTDLLNYKTSVPKLDLVRIQNFKNLDKKFKTLVCHDMAGGYLNYDKLRKYFYYIIYILFQN